jgi:hypothetical protein
MTIAKLLTGFGVAWLFLAVGCSDDPEQQQTACDEFFSQISGYISCDVKPLSCTFYWKSDQTSSQGGIVELPCSEVCRMAGAPCIEAWAEQMDGSCEKQKNPDMPSQELAPIGCAEAGSDAICECGFSGDN